MKRGSNSKGRRQFKRIFGFEPIAVSPIKCKKCGRKNPASYKCCKQ